MGLGDLGLSAVASLQSIDRWIATINSNMAGTGRVGYKASEVKFGGGTVSSSRPIVAPRLGVNIAEQSLGVVQTTVDYSQGAVVASTDFAHLAIQRTSATPGMFVLSSLPGGGPTADYYYTFDGEFHFDTNGFLVNNDGLYLMSINRADGVDGTPYTADDVLTFGNALGPDAGDVVNDQISLDRVAMITVPNPQLRLEFSRYGATTFQEVGANNNQPGTGGSNFTILDNLANVDNVGNYSSGNGASGRVIPNALEASNSSLTAETPKLALAQKMYAAIAKVISVALQNIDVVLNLSR